MSSSHTILGKEKIVKKIVFLLFDFIMKNTKKESNIIKINEKLMYFQII